ncbi:MAG: YibE/F family protein [Eubacterium sp.]
MKKRYIRQIIAIVFVIVFGVVLYFFNQVDKTELLTNDGRAFEKAVVTEIITDNLTENGNRVGQQTVKLRIETGEHKGEEITASSSSSYLYGADCVEGLKVIAIVSESGDTVTASVYNYDRGNILYLIILFFIAMLWFIGGKKGLNSAIGLVFTFVCIIFLFLPMIYRGVSPILSAVVIVILTTFVVMYLIDGLSVKSLCAMGGTIAGVIISALFAALFGYLSNISGENVPDIENLMYIGQMTDIKVGELMFAGILISTLGAVMDVAISVASTVNEIHEKNPLLGKKELFSSGINVGRDMMGTMSNTLILAFTGSSINTLVYIYSYNYSYYQVLNMYSIGIEIIQGISATLGVILTVPLVAFISSVLLSHKKSMQKSD